ncbi:winged helix-turn-helix domain-containing tetratricopeptide repeat protein [Tabrizicola sp.]|uniref:winged helix-turn-helix domain-containing tetratricopeptide repeat protein n=1 Tax=Tabrizicola sp. TaxID=2005166 RepID=UPI00273651E6|nr:winged helix-turn-helix domain-containing protein [Tabrizicola sp.]MDP3195509.1 winged helix-turn-helix domain-containing protein [Tabrizicola sp.]
MPHAIGPLLFDPAQRTLTRDGVAVELGQRAADLLVALMDAKGAPVPKADLMDRVWPGSVVEEGNLTVQIANLRKLMGTDAKGRDWIVTVPRLGYRLVVPDGPAPGPVGTTRPVIAALPFQNLSGDVDSDYFADGVVADILAALSRFGKLAVVSRSSSFVYKGRSQESRSVAAELGAGYLLEGSVRRAGARLRITAQLVEGATGVSLWTERFDGDLAEVFDFQDRITERVATLVAPAIEATELAQSRQSRPESILTYDILLRAKAFLDDETEAGNRAAHDLLEKALQQEPHNPQILGHIVWALEHRCAMGWPLIHPDDVQRCVDYARRGIQHAAGDARVLGQCAIALIQPGRDYEAGMAVIEQAARANPNDIYVLQVAGVMHAHSGDLDTALHYFDRALRRGLADSSIRFALTGSAHVHILKGNHSVALGFASRSLALNDRFDATYWMLIAGHAHLGQIDKARDWLRALLTIAPHVSLARRQHAKAKKPGRMARAFPHG